MAEIAVGVLHNVGNAREKLVNPGRRPRVGLPPAIGEKSHQMLVDREIRETLPAFRHQRDAGAADTVRSPAIDALAGKADRPARDRLKAADGAQRGRLAHARAVGDFQSADL